MDLETKYDDLAGGEENKGKKAGVESTFSKDANANVGTGPSPKIADGGIEGEAKQPKENTGNQTSMGGAKVGNASPGNASEVNDNTGGQ